MRYITLDDTIKLMKDELKRTFPGVKFGLRRSRGTGAGTVHVTWTDGPKYAAVTSIADHYAGAGFDGMTDSSYSIETVDVRADGTPEAIRYGTRYVLCQRTQSDAYRAPFLRKLLRCWSDPTTGPAERARLLALADGELVRAMNSVRMDGEWATTLAYRIEQDTFGHYATMQSVSGERAP